MRAIIGLALGIALAVVGSFAVAGSSYTPPAASGGGVEGDGTGVTDASAFRSALGLGTAATLTAGTAANNAVQLDGTGKLPAVDGSALTGIPVGIPEGGLMYQALLKVSDLDYESGWTSLGGAAFYETSAFTAADDLLTSIAGQSWASGTQLLALTGTDTAGLVSTGTSAGNVVVLDGSAKLPAVDGSALTGLAGGDAIVNVYTADDTWTKPAGANIVDVWCIGGGGGGGAGRRAAGLTSGIRKNGGGGGGGGGYARSIFRASDLSGTVAVTVGLGGDGGAAASGDTTFNNGTDGEASSFGTYLTAAGGSGGTTSAASTNNAGGAGGVSAFDGGTGGSGSNGAQNAGAAVTGKGAGAGGGGGGTGGNSTTAWSPTAGSAGTVWTAAAGGNAGVSGGSNPTAGSAGASAATALLGGGGGGGGGVPAYNQSAAGAAGGDGGLYGGGGGGGGGGETTSGKGGDGADGVCVVVTYQ